MALPVPHPFTEATVQAFSRSIGGTPETAYMRAPFRGKLIKVGCVTQGVITTADATLTTSIGATAVTGGVVTVTVSGAAAGQHFSTTPTGANTCNEDDVVSVVPTGASGATIGGQVYGVFVRA